MRASVLPGPLRSLWLLGTAFFKVQLLRLFGRKTGLPVFEANYGPDRLPALSPREQAELPRFSGCIACGLCDQGEGERMAASRGAYPGLMQIVLSSTRSFPDFDAAALALEHVPDAVLAAKEPLCPTNVPFVALARFVRAKAADTARGLVVVPLADERDGIPTR
jgi:hypothetical protein